MTEQRRGMQWSQKFDTGEIFVLYSEPNETEDAFLGRVDTLRTKITAKFPPAAASPDYVAPGRTGAGSFTVDSIQLASGGEHPRWVVKGGNFKRFGVTCWPEVLEAAGILDKLDPLKENTPSGNWTAHYQEKTGEDGNPKPDKVLRLERA